MFLLQLVASIFLMVFLPACLGEPSDQCPPRELSNPCRCSWWDPGRDDWGTWTQGKNCLYCQNIAEREVLTDVLTQTKDYSYEFLSIISPHMESLPAGMFEIKTRFLTRLFVLSASLRTMFDATPTAYGLREFYANKVRLSEFLNWDLFEGMPNLERLTFTNSPSLQLDRQFVEHAPTSLDRIDFSNCSLSELPSNVFQALRHLTVVRLNDGLIGKLEKSMFPPQIEEFSFQNQRIQEIPQDFFKDMSNLRWVSLAENQISKLPKDTFEEPLSRDSVVYFDLRDNPIDCDCKLTWITSLDDSARNKLSGQCAKPKLLHGKELRDLTEDDFNDCPRLAA